MIYDTGRPGGPATPPHPDVLLLVYEKPMTTVEDVAARLGIGVHEAQSKIATLVRIGYVRNMDIDGGDFFRTRRAGSRVAEEVVKRDNEFWIQAPDVAYMGPEELAELRSRRSAVTGSPCPVPSCSGRKIPAPRVDLEWGCPVCGLVRVCDTATLMSRLGPTR